MEESITDMKNDKHVETRPEDLARPAFEEKPEQKESTSTGIAKIDNPDMEDNAYVTEAVFDNTRTEQLEEPTSKQPAPVVTQDNDYLEVLKLLKTVILSSDSKVAIIVSILLMRPPVTYAGILRKLLKLFFKYPIVPLTSGDPSVLDTSQ